MIDKALVNGIEVKTDGAWYQCPNCLRESCVLMTFCYCPMCATELDSFEEMKNE